jgi:hypothetical protein
MPEPHPLIISVGKGPAGEAAQTALFIGFSPTESVSVFGAPDLKRDTLNTTRDLSAITKSTNKEKMTEDLRQPYIASLLGRFFSLGLNKQRSELTAFICRPICPIFCPTDGLISGCAGFNPKALARSRLSALLPNKTRVGLCVRRRYVASPNLQPSGAPETSWPAAINPSRGGYRPSRWRQMESDRRLIDSARRLPLGCEIRDYQCHQL